MITATGGGGDNVPPLLRYFFVPHVVVCYLMYYPLLYYLRMLCIEANVLHFRVLSTISRRRHLITVIVLIWTFVVV